MTVTAKEVAQHCGLSRETVAQILHGRGDRYRQITRDKVLAAANSLGYRPNSAARAMRLGRFRSIGIICATEAGLGRLDSSLLLGIEHAARNELHLTIGQVGDEQLSNRDGLPRIVGEWSCDGLLVNYVARFPPGIRELLTNSHIPAIWLNVRHEVDCIYPDDRGAAEAATRHLVELGHRRIAWFNCTGGEHYSKADRSEGYGAIMRAAGLGLHCHNVPIHGAGEALGAAARALFRAPERPTAVVCYSANEAVPAAFAAASLGLAIPRDLSLVCLGPVSPDVLGLDVTQAQPDFFDMGTRAVELVNRRIVEPDRPLPSVIHPFTWIPGATTAPPAVSPS
jgi:LacI family transcriptional regulator